MGKKFRTYSKKIESSKGSLVQPHRRHKRPANELRVSLNKVENILFNMHVHLVQFKEAFRQYWDVFVEEYGDENAGPRPRSIER